MNQNTNLLVQKYKKLDKFKINLNLINKIVLQGIILY